MSERTAASSPPFSLAVGPLGGHRLRLGELGGKEALMANYKPTPTTDEPLLVSIREAARLLSISPNTAWSLLASGQLHPVRIGRRTLVARTTLDAFIADLQRNGGGR